MNTPENPLEALPRVFLVSSGTSRIRLGVGPIARDLSDRPLRTVSLGNIRIASVYWDGSGPMTLIYGTGVTQSVQDECWNADEVLCCLIDALTTDTD